MIDHAPFVEMEKAGKLGAYCSLVLANSSIPLGLFCAVMGVEHGRMNSGLYLQPTPEFDPPDELDVVRGLMRNDLAEAQVRQNNRKVRMTAASS